MTNLWSDEIEWVVVQLVQAAVQRWLKCFKGPQKPSNDNGAVHVLHISIGSGDDLALP